MAAGAPESRKLMAELHWLLLAFPSDVGPETKAARIRDIWSWSGETLPEAVDALTPAVLGGIGHTGTAYNTHRWRELNFLIGWLRNFKARPRDERAALVADGAAFAACLDGIEGVAGRQLRHILPHLLFPDAYERISSLRHKRDILEGFGRATRKEASLMSVAELDAGLAAERARLATELGREIDFYDDDIAARWRASGASWLLSWNPEHSAWEAFDADRRKILDGETVTDTWRTSSSKPKSGDRVWLVRTGQEPRAIVARGQVIRPPFAAPHWQADRAAAGETVQMIEVEFDDLRDPFGPEALPLERLKAAAPGQEWSPQSSGIQIKPAAARALAALWEGEAPAAPLPTPPMTGSRMALNTILYGPPGTGKTFATTRRAVEICDGAAPADPAVLRARYEALRAQGRIAFVTFHQSYGYEDFIEGLRPKIADEGPGFTLEPVAGVLKTIAERAASRRETRKGSFDRTGKRVFKVSLGRANVADDAYLRDECLSEGLFRLGYGGEIDWSGPEFSTWQAIFDRWKQVDPETGGNNPNVVQIWQLRAAMREGDVVIASQGNKAVQAIGLVSGRYRYDLDRTIDEYRHTRPVTWLWTAEHGAALPASDFTTKGLSQVSIYQMSPDNIRWENLLPYLEQTDDDARPLPHVLIIDEINRANISKVMGELITLLEEDKRRGAPNAAEVILPYSKEPFALPPNLYLLGTMNTADRSIALIDTALRRRFHFEELPPQPAALAGAGLGIDLVALLAALNERLEYFLGPDLLIGHAWFMGLSGRADLDAVMARKVIPLLREYFHDDLDRVRSVLGGGDGFLRRDALKTPKGSSETRFRYVDRYPEGGYDDTAYAEAIGLE